MAENSIKKTIEANIGQINNVFVFPTQTAADLWADQTIKNTKIKAVAMERFLAWDTFKGSSIKSHQKGKTSIPSTMRQIFAAQLISINAQEPFLESLIPAEFAKTASGFVNWISGLLPSLSIWKKYFDNLKKEPDAEDRDLLKLYEKYSEFLNKYNLFDPAWERPPFIPDQNHYFIFFPEILSDYAEYKDLLEQSKEDITLIHLPEENNYSPSVQFYQNSRTEIRSLALQLHKIHEEKNISWDEIAISVPNMESYGPYLDRELEIYEIPHVMRYAKPLSSSGAGNLFSLIQECASSNYSFENIKDLLLISELPWKEPKLSMALIQFGQDNNCICSFTNQGNRVDVWEKSFQNRPGTSINVINYYRSLKEIIGRITSAESFDKIRSLYFEFRNKFFNMDECPETTDKLISRCISELGALIDLEQSFPDCKVSNPYSFFVNQLGNTNYLEQTSERGIQVLPYRTGATAPFACHLIVDSSQASLSVIYKELSFLREDKRAKLLKREDSNVSEFFIQLYAMNSMESEIIFTCAQKTFSGYAQPSSYLNLLDYSNKEKEPEFLNHDVYLDEKAYYKQESSGFSKITETERKGFEFWKECQRLDFSESETTKDYVSNSIKEVRQKGECFRISYSHLKNFCECNRKWLLKNIARLETRVNEAELMDGYEMGSLYHIILQNYCDLLHDNKKILYVENEELTEEYNNYLKTAVDAALNNKYASGKDLRERDKNSYIATELLSTTRDAIFNTIKNTVIEFSKKFIGYTVYKTEAHYEYQIPETNILCEGYIDCLLQNPSDGDFALIDYKSSKYSIPAKSMYIEDIGPDEYPNFQMPIYLYLLKNQETPLAVEECYFFSIKDQVAVEFDISRLPPVEDKLEEAIQNFANYLQFDRFFENPEKDFSTCNSCDYRAVCRKVFNVGQGK